MIVMIVMIVVIVVIVVRLKRLSPIAIGVVIVVKLLGCHNYPGQLHQNLAVKCMIFKLNVR